MYRATSIFLLIFLFNSCDDKIIDFTPKPEDGLDFQNESFSTSLTQSSFASTPDYINQDLGPLLYIGSMMESNETSSALFQISSEIFKDYQLCIENEDIKNRGDIKFRLVSPDDLIQGNFSTYYYDGDEIIDFSENGIYNHDDANIGMTMETIKNQGNILIDEVDDQTNFMYFTLFDVDECTFEDNKEDCNSSEYTNCEWNDDDVCLNPDFSNGSAFLSWEDLCGTNDYPDYFYILIEYSNLSESISLYSSNIPSETGYSAYVPSLMAYYEIEFEQENMISKFSIDNISHSASLNIDDILYSDESYDWKFNCSAYDTENCGNYEYCYLNNDECLWSDMINNEHNIIIANRNPELDNFGTLYGLQMDNSDEVIYESSSLEEPITFTIDIEINDSPDNLNFFFAKAAFNYNNDNIDQDFDYGEVFNDTGSDGCYNIEESGDIKIDFDLQDCLPPYSWSEEDGCYFDYNNDDSYKLCVEEGSPSGYRDENNGGIENNEKFDCDDLDEDGECDSLDNSEDWQDLGFDLVDDDYETGCRIEDYNHGIGYTGDSDETYLDLTGGDVDFYQIEYSLKNGNIITLCGQQFWDNPEDIKGCRVCSKNDPNGDNYNPDPAGDDYDPNIDDNSERFEGNGQYDPGEPFLDFGIDQIENYSSDNTDTTEGNGEYDLGEKFFDTGLDGFFTGDEIGYCLECRQENGLKDRAVDPDSGDELFSEYKDYGFDECPNQFETGNPDNPCDDTLDNFYSNEKQDYLDLNRDDLNIDPNGDDAPGTEDNGQYDPGENLDENIVLDIEAISGDLSVNLGSNLYYYELDEAQDYAQPILNGYEKVTLWISKIENNEDDSYSLTISMLSQVDINSFEIQLSHVNKKSSFVTVNDIAMKHLTPFKYEDSNNNGSYDTYSNYEIFLEDSKQYIKDVSLHSFPPLSNDADMLISYGYGMDSKLYFDGLNDFLYDNDETTFISYSQTNLFIYFDIAEYPIPEGELFLKLSGSIGNISVTDFIQPIKISSSVNNRIKIGLGPLIDELLLNSSEILDNDLIFTLSIDNYTHQLNSYYNYYMSAPHRPIYDNYFTILKMSDENLPHIDIFYSE